MKSIIKFGSKLGICIFAVMTFSTNSAQAQLGDIGAFLQGGAEDATLLTREYLRPLATGIPVGLNAGWNGSAAPRKLLGFSLEIRTSIAIVPDTRKTFDINALNLENLELQPGENPIVPTINGTDSGSSTLDIMAGPDGFRQDIGDLTLPAGTGIGIIPTPMIQAGIGLIRSTDVSLRYVPEVSIGDFGDITVLGGSIKTEITDWFPGGRLLPVDISLQAGITQVDLNADLDVPGSDDQRVETSTSSYVINALVGKKLPIISVYAGVGIQGGSIDVDVKGDFDIQTVVNGMQSTQTISDPISFSLDSDVNVHALGGFRLKLGFLSIFVEGTASEYSTINGGIGFGLRN